MSAGKDHGHPPAYHDEDTYYNEMDEEKQGQMQAPADDPFGNDEEGEVQYRVMNWWYVGPFESVLRPAAALIDTSTGTLECVSARLFDYKRLDDF
jgi:hypothetical protein